MKFQDYYFPIFFSLFFLLSQSAFANGTWNVLKTGAGGWMTGMHIHPSGEPVYARSDVGSAYRWDEGTKEWTNVVTSSSIPTSDVHWKLHYGVLSLVSAPSNKNVAYMAFYNCIYKSTNKGDTWTRTAFPNIFMPPNSDESKYSGERLAVDPVNENIVYFGSIDNGLFVTQNGGQSWNQVAAIPLGTPNRGVSQLLIDPSGGSANGKSNLIYVVVDGAGAFKSTNGGTSWTNISSGLGFTTWFRDLDVSPNGMLYTCTSDAGSNHAVKRYYNGSWTTVTPNTGWALYDVACDPTNSDKVYIKTEGSGPFFSTSNATANSPSWNSHTHSRDATNSDVPWHAWTSHGWLSTGEMVVDPIQPNRLWHAEGVGLFRTTDINDGDMTWVGVSNGQEHMVSNHLVVLNNQTLIQAFWDRPMFVRNSNDLDDYPTRHYPSSRFSSTWDMGVTPADPNFVVAITEDHRYCCYSDGLHRNSGYSMDGGQTWTRFGSMPDPTNDYGIFGNISVSSNDINNIVWLPTGNKMPYYSTNRGATWTQATIPGNSGNCCITAPWFIRKVLVADNVLANTFYIYDFGNGKVYRSTNGGASWTTRSSSLPAYAYHGKLRAVPGKAGHLFFSSSHEENESNMRGIYHSTDGGATWNLMSNTNRVLNVTIGKEAPGANYPTIYIHGNVNGDFGFHMSTNTGQSWTKIGTYPTGIYSWSKVMVADPFKFGRLYVGYGCHSFVYYDHNVACPVAGTPCDDNNPKTTNDVEDGNCNCAGTCPPVGTVCDDNNPATYDDREDGSCVCIGVPCPAAGTACDDNNPNTTNDKEDGFCNCTGTPVGGGNCNEFTTSGSKIINPCGTEFFGVGMNAAFNVLAGPFVFQALDNRQGPCNSAFDIWPGQTNFHNGTECYPGGGVNTFDIWSPQLNGVTTVPDRYYAMNGTLTQSAINAGITQPADHWHQNILRANIICEGAPTPPGPSDIIAATIPAIQEALDAGMVVMADMHSTTAQNLTPNAAWNAPTSSFSGKFGCSIEVFDAVVTQFKTDGNATGQGNDPVKQGYVWLEPSNEPWDGASGFCPSQDYLNTQTFFIQRIRNYHQAENIIVIDMHNWAQSLNSLAGGCYDNWWTSLKNHPSGDLTRNVVMSWHNYGAQAAGGSYTYADMDNHLNTILNTGTPAGYTFPIIVGEYGQAAQPGTGNAGPDQWNRNGFEYMMTNIHGQALADKYNINPIVWNASGDASNWTLYKLTRGPAAATNDGLGIPFWDIESGNDPFLEPMGVAHWNISHTIWNKNTPCPIICGNCPPAGTACDDNDPNTTNDVYDNLCVCAGTCAVVGNTCDDNNPNTINDVYNNDCMCVGTPVNIPDPGICQFDSPPVLDGDDSEWTADSIFYPTIVLGGTVAGPSDLVAEFKLGWDDNYLYVFGKVTDDALFNDSPNPWNDDCLELYIDGGNEKGTAYDGNDFQLMFRYNDPVAYNVSGGVNNPPGLDFVMVPTNLGYNVEIRASWAFIGIPSIVNGDKIGLDIHVNDDDDGGARDKWISWNDDLDMAWTNPSTFGEILFKDCQSTGYITPNICLWMEGTYDPVTNKMSTQLNQRSLLPMAQPYNNPPWNYVGTETVSSFPPQAVDWVKVSFRTNPSKASEVLATAAILQEDGCLVFPDPDFFPENLGLSFYVVVEHRNHIGVMSPTSININQGMLTYDFRDTDSYSVGGQGQKLVNTGTWAMFAGDGDQLQDINGYDINGIDNASWVPQNGGFNVYGYADYNLDGEVSGMDKILWSVNNGVYSALDR